MRRRHAIVRPSTNHDYLNSEELDFVVIFIRKMLVLFILCFLQVSLGEDMKDLGVKELLELARDVTDVSPHEIYSQDVTFFLTNHNVSSIQVTPKNYNKFARKAPVKFLVHGWLENHQRTWYQDITQEFLRLGDYNIIQVDWAKPARFQYLMSAVGTKKIGYFISKFILNLNHTDLDTIHLIGHSLGSHIVGFTGKFLFKKTQQKVGRITGLDPAGPYFRNVLFTEQDHLSKNDAKIVDVIHTDAKYFGYELPLGTLDLYINEGTRIQPGCLEDFISDMTIGHLFEDSFCSHQRSIVYFTEAINRGKFVCERKCDQIHTIILGEQCNKNVLDQVSFGEEEITEDLQGICYVTTREKPPFLPLN